MSTTVDDVEDEGKKKRLSTMSTTVDDVEG
jgi:hypothetical protein